MVTYSSQTHRGDAAALPAIRISAKLAGSYPRPEIGRDNFFGFCKDAFPRVHGRVRKFANDCFRHFEHGILQPQLPKIGNYRNSLRSCEYLGVGSSTLRSKDAE